MNVVVRRLHPAPRTVVTAFPPFLSSDMVYACVAAAIGSIHNTCLNLLKQAAG